MNPRSGKVEINRDIDLRKHLAGILNWHDAHVDFDEAVDGVPEAVRGTRPEAIPYSLWELLEHLRLAQRDILDFCRDSDYSAPKWPEGYWPASESPPSKGAWKKSVFAFHADRKALSDLISDTSIDLFAEIPWGSGQTYFREALLAADHAAYHVGEMVALRRMLGVWKKKP